jgi:hypothetical protein
MIKNYKHTKRKRRFSREMSNIDINGQQFINCSFYDDDVWEQIINWIKRARGNNKLTLLFFILSLTFVMKQCARWVWLFDFNFFCCFWWIFILRILSLFTVEAVNLRAFSLTFFKHTKKTSRRLWRGIKFFDRCRRSKRPVLTSSCHLHERPKTDEDFWKHLTTL